jgi:cytochrome c peroxidase
MRTGIIAATFTLVAILAYSIADLRDDHAPTRETHDWFMQQVRTLQNRVDDLCAAIAAHQEQYRLQEAFRQARLAYKPLELVITYYMPYTDRFIKGPNLQETEPDEKDVIIDPEGFQVIEALLFPSLAAADTAQLRKEALRLQASLHRLQTRADQQSFTDAQLFDAMRQELLRIASLGLSGFDSPEALHSLPEAAAALHGVASIWHFYAARVQLIHPALAANTEDLLTAAGQSLQASVDFNSLDRLAFISKYLNPLSVNLKLAREALDIPYIAIPHFLDPAASNAFAKGALDPVFFAPNQAQALSHEQVALGRRLFYDPVLSYNGQRSCAGCHQPQRAFTDGLKTPSSLPGEAPVTRNTPTILNAALQPGQFYDMRVAYLEDQVNMVVHNKAEMHGDLQGAAAKLKEEPTYQQLFKDAFHITPQEINSYRIQQAIAAYIRSLTRLNSPFDAYMRGDSTQLTPAAKRGFNLFMGKAKCGTCHFMPLFNGVAPPDFTKAEAEILGVPAVKDKAILDTDSGRYHVHKIALYRFAFKTPTLRNIALTAPYMHNGVFNTLE